MNQEVLRAMAKREQCTLGTFLAGRLVEIGAAHIFGVPGNAASSPCSQFMLAYAPE